MSLAAVFLNFGYLLGALLSGIIFDRFNEVIQLTICIPVMAAVIIATPWMPNVYLYYMGVSCSNFLQGYLHTGCVPFTLALWADHRLKQPFFQGLTTLRTIGSFVFPFLCIPFLSDLTNINVDVVNSSHLLERPLTLGNTTPEINPMTKQSNETELVLYSNSSDVFIEDIHRVRYTFLIIAFFLLVNFLSFIFLYSCTKIKLGHAENSHKALTVPDEECQRLTRNSKITIKLVFILAIIFTLFFFFYEYMTGSMLYTFAFSGLHLRAEMASIMVSLFYGAQCVGRIAAMVISAFISASRILIINIFFTLVGLTVMMFVPLNANLAWFATAIIGLFVSSTFPSIQLWLSNYITVTGSVSAALLIASSISCMVGMALGGYFYQNFGHMSVMYLALAAAVINSIIYVVMTVLSRLIKRSNWKNINIKYVP